MDSTKQPSKEDIDALLAVASKPASEKELEKELNTVEQWVYVNDIKPGDHIIKPYALYYAYKKWATKPVTFQTFSREFKKLFIQQRITTPNGSQVCYYVDPAAFDISLDTHFQVLKELREARERRKKKKKYEQKKASGKTEAPQS